MTIRDVRRARTWGRGSVIAVGAGLVVVVLAFVVLLYHPAGPAWTGPDSGDAALLARSPSTAAPLGTISAEHSTGEQGIPDLGLTRTGPRGDVPAQDGQTPSGIANAPSGSLQRLLPGGNSKSSYGERAASSVSSLDTVAVPRPDPAFEAYLKWLRHVETLRSELHADLSRPRTVDNAVGHAETPLAEELRSFRARILAAKPPVPADCWSLDRYYTTALNAETGAIDRVGGDLASGDTPRGRQFVRQQNATIDSNVSMGNLELDRVLRTRAARDHLRLQDSESFPR